MDLITGLGGFLFISILWAFFLFSVLKIRFKTPKKSMILILFFFMGLGIIILMLGAVIEYMDSPEFCGTACHSRAGVVVDDAPMQEYYESYTEPGNNSIMRVHAENDITCAHCHDKPGLSGKAEAYYNAMFEMANYITGNYDPDNLGGHFDNENCLKCHNGEVAQVPGEVMAPGEVSVNPHNSDKKCADCHAPHQNGIGLSIEGCTSCHDVDIDELIAHGSTAGSECMDCHDREHPSDAKISFEYAPDLINSEFCSDCHQSQVNNYYNWADADRSFYGDCTSICHTEHKVKTAPHSTNAPFDKTCNDCHTEGPASHNLSSITYSDYPYKIPSEFCSDCHQGEYERYSIWDPGVKSFYGSCTTTCHPEHREVVPPHITLAPYDEQCYKCHTEGTALHTEPAVTFFIFPYEIDNEFCADCHPNEFDEYNAWSSSEKTLYGNCATQCHIEHKVKDVPHITIPPYEDNCIECHVQGVSSHNLASVSYHNLSFEIDNELCGSCHESEYKAYSGWTENEKSIFGNCYTACHKEHREAEVPHITTAPYGENCDECHVEGVSSHKLSSVTIKDFSFEIGIDFCASCHETESMAYDTWSPIKKSIYGNCSSTCHSEHKAAKVPHTTSAPYDENCDNCHYKGVASHQLTEISYSNIASQIDNEFCANCHQKEYGRYSEWTPSEKSFYGDCFSICHTDHREIASPHTIAPPYDGNCDQCHLEGVASHKLSSVTLTNFTYEIGNNLCGSCHKSEFSVYTSWTVGQRTFYGNCTTMCHDEHRQSKIVHSTAEPYGGNCDKCHVEGVSSHKLSSVTYKNFDTQPDNEFCSSCHISEYEAHESWSPAYKSFYGNCTTACHTDHNAINVPHKTNPPYEDNCNDCHTDGVESHTLTVSYLNFEYKIDNEFCANCHKTEYNSLNSNLHKTENCSDCHSEHNDIIVKFEKCKSCHTKIPVIHNQYTRECGNCHNTKVIHP